MKNSKLVKRMTNQYVYQKVKSEIRRLSYKPILEYSGDSDFITRLIEFYYKNNNPDVNFVKCMFTGIDLPMNSIRGPHLFKLAFSADRAYAELDIDIEDCRNGYFL